MCMRMRILLVCSLQSSLPVLAPDEHAFIDHMRELTAPVWGNQSLNHWPLSFTFNKFEVEHLFAPCNVYHLHYLKLASH